MSYIVAGKADVTSLLFHKTNRSEIFELYLRTLDDFDEQKIIAINNRTHIVSVHQPTYVDIGGKLSRFNILSRSAVGEKSKTDLRELITKCYRQGITKIILHAARYNPQEMDTGKAIEEFVSVLDKTPDPSHITVEYDVFWFNTVLSNSIPLISSSTILRSLMKKTEVGITLDVEHFIISNLYTKFCNERINVNRGEKSEMAFNNWIHTDTNLKIADLYKELHNFIEEFKDRINHIHLNGTDWFNYFLKKSLPLVGEHLPLGYNEEKIKDRLDYLKLIRILKMLPQKKEIVIVLEIGKRDNLYDYFQTVSDSIFFLRKYL